MTCLTPLTALAFAVVDLRRLRAGLRRARHHGHQHAGHLRIDAVLRRAVELARRVQPARALAQDAEVLRILQHRRGRHGQLGRRGRERAVAELLAALVDAPGRPRCGTRRRHLPLRGGGGHEHLARRGTGLAHRLPGRRAPWSSRRWPASGTSGCCRPCRPVPARRAPSSSRHRALRRPASGWRSARPGPFRRTADHGDLTIAADAQEGVGREGRGGVEAPRQAGQRQREADAQGRTGAALQEAAAGGFAACPCSGSFTSVTEASLMAARISLVGAAAADVAAMAPSMSASEGLRLLSAEQRHRAHDLARLAVAALRHVDLRPGLPARRAACDVGFQSPSMVVIFLPAASPRPG
jgi:hypothetical protein